MERNIPFEFDYFQENEADQFSFYRIPKLLFSDHHFDGLSTDAKVVYGFMLDRMGLSRKNGWVDKKGRVYIIFSVDDIAEQLNCGHAKSVKLLSELDCKKGIGLIERVRRGLGLPDIIYIKNFASGQVNMDATSAVPEQSFEPSESSESCCNNVTASQSVISDSKSTDSPGYQNDTSRSSKIELQEVSKSNFKKYQNRTSESSKNELQEVSKSNSNNTNINNTEFSDTKSIYPSSISSQYRDMCIPQTDGRMDGKMEQIKSCEERIKANIDYDALVGEVCPNDKRCVDEIVAVMVDAIGTYRDTVSVAGTEYPYQYVADRLYSVDYFDIQDIVDAIGKSRKEVKNIKAYILSCVFNAPVTSGNYYRAAVSAGRAAAADAGG